MRCRYCKGDSCPLCQNQFIGYFLPLGTDWKEYCDKIKRVERPKKEAVILDYAEWKKKLRA